MKQRNLVAVFLLTLITLGIYNIVWLVKTKLEMNRLGAKIPTAWLIIIPFVNIWWFWKYSEGVNQVTGGNVHTILAFLLLWLVPFIDMLILQYEFNKVGNQAVPAQPEALGTPAPGFGAPAQTAPVSTNIAGVPGQPTTASPGVPTENENQSPQV